MVYSEIDSPIKSIMRELDRQGTLAAHKSIRETGPSILGIGSLTGGVKMPVTEKLLTYSVLVGPLSFRSALAKIHRWVSNQQELASPDTCAVH